MNRDIRQTLQYQDAESLYRVLLQPGIGALSDLAEVHAATDGTHVLFTGTFVDALDTPACTRICRVELLSGHLRVLTFGPSSDRLPKYSPDGRWIAFLSDRRSPGDFQLYLLDTLTGRTLPTPPVDGWVEYLHWAPDGRRILLGVAGHGADVAGAQGAVRSQRAGEGVLDWMPQVDVGDDSYRWRCAWIYEVEANAVRKIETQDCNIWEAVWCGNDTLVAVVSVGPQEGLWYDARLHLIDTANGRHHSIFVPREQLGGLCAAPSGRRVAVIEAICSDRSIVAGDLIVIDTSTGKLARLDTRGVDVSYAEWRDDDRLLLAGHRGFETVVGVCERPAGGFREIWRSQHMSTAGLYASVSGFGAESDCALIAEGFTQAPQIGVIRGNQYHAVKPRGMEHSDRLSSVMECAEPVTWNAPDGLEIQGWLLHPKNPAPHALAMHVHGGPVWHWHPVWLGRRNLYTLLLLERGYAYFLPNPRGSSGRGQEFVRHVVGDMGGADAQDLLSGLDHLVKSGKADARRLGILGKSYGGYMTSWLISQDDRFTAAVAMSPVTNFVTEHLLSNIPHFVSLFLADRYHHRGGKYFERSPVMYANQVRTPTLNICGALDRCTPPEEARQFHNALLEKGTRSVLVTYPHEGHGVSGLPAAIDCAARVVLWFEEHIRTGATVEK